VVDHHLSPDNFPDIFEYLQSAQEDLKTERIKEKLIRIAKGPNKEIEEKEKARIELSIIKIVEAKKEQKAQVNEYIKQLAKLEYPVELSNDLDWLEKNLEPPSEKKESSKEGFTIVDTDDYWDLFMCGTDVEGSCQRVDGNPNLNKCLLAYVMDGENRLLAIKGPDGKIEARAILRLLYDAREKSPVLFMERIYSNAFGRYDQALIGFAKKRAEEFGLPLLRSEGSSLYEGKVESLGGFLPYEYSDAAAEAGGGVKERGIFSINKD
jgi:hypothetical protein